MSLKYALVQQALTYSIAMVQRVGYTLFVIHIVSLITESHPGHTSSSAKSTRIFHSVTVQPNRPSVAGRCGGAKGTAFSSCRQYGIAAQGRAFCSDHPITETNRNEDLIT